MSSSYYAKALKAGQKEFRQARHRGLYPYLPALDELISRADIVSEVNLGLVHIPLDLIAGTKTAGRKSAFSCNFMPLLSPSSELPTNGPPSVSLIWTKGSTLPSRPTNT